MPLIGVDEVAVSSGSIPLGELRVPAAGYAPVGTFTALMDGNDVLDFNAGP